MKVIHLRTGDAAIDDRIAAWLRRHAATVVECADAFEACVVAIKHRQPPPQLAFIGADWLAPDEFSILGYLRETWPTIGIVVTGSPRVIATFPASPRTHICRSEAMLQQMFASTPAVLYEQLAGGVPHLDDPAVTAPVVPAVFDPDTLTGPPLALRAQHAMPRPAGAAPGHMPPAGGAEPRMDNDLDPSDITGRPLTPEEVAALLDDDQR